jgi:D-lactate dehydrogenase (cytochrome)
MSLLRVPVTQPRGSIGPGAEPCLDPAIVDGYLRDASGEVGQASALFRPQCEADIAAVLKRAGREDVGVTVVAMQTSTTASSVPREGWVLSTENLADEPSVAAQSLRAVCGAGHVLGAFQDLLAEAALLYPPDPTSRYECSLGGSVACNASGPRSHRYGATRNWVRGMRVVLCCGEVLDLRRGQWLARRGDQFHIEHACGEQAGGVESIFSSIPVPSFFISGEIKNAAGYSGGDEVDLIDLFIGSEGTLGVVVEVEVELVPLPAGVFNFFACFENESDALDMIETSRDADPGVSLVRADCLEWFDRASLDLIGGAMPAFEVPERAEVAIFVEQLTNDEPDDDLAGRWLDLLEGCGALIDLPGGVRVAQTQEQREELRRVRHAVPTGVNERAARNGMPKLGTDLAVADADLRRIVGLYHRAAQEPLSLLAAVTVETLRSQAPDAQLPSKLEAVTFGHVGDNHLHMNFLPKNALELRLTRAVYAALTSEVIAMGGSISAEHGIGKIKRAAFRQQVGEAGFVDMLAVKRALDPRNMLGRGNLFDDLALA